MKTYNCKRKPKHFTKGKYRRKGLYEVRYSKKSSKISGYGLLYSDMINFEIVCDKYYQKNMIENNKKYKINKELKWKQLKK